MRAHFTDTTTGPNPRLAGCDSRPVHPYPTSIKPGPNRYWTSLTMTPKLEAAKGLANICWQWHPLSQTNGGSSVSLKTEITASAEALDVARSTGIVCDPISSLLSEPSLEDAYSIQALNTDRWLSQGRRLVGRKIGLTAKSVQTQMGVKQPDYGMLFADMSVDEGAEIPIGALMQPRAEAEIAFVLSKDLPEVDTTTAEVMAAIDFAVAAIEIVDSRIKDWNIGIIDTIADNASSGLYVLGSSPVGIRDLDLLNCGMVMERQGEPVSVGAGRACLGSPISATAWLARTMAAAGRPLSAGDVVLSGALGPVVPVAPGDVIQVRISGLGEVTAAFAREGDQR